MLAMRSRTVRVLVLLWLGWYLSGPVCEMVDSWDTPPEEIQDIAFHSGGVLGLVAAAFSVGVALARKVRTLCRALARPARTPRVTVTELRLPVRITFMLSPQGISPPAPLRI